MHAGKQSDESDSVAGAFHERILSTCKDGKRNHGVQNDGNIFDFVGNFVFSEIKYNKFGEILEPHVVQRLDLVAFDV